MPARESIAFFDTAMMKYSLHFLLSLQLGSLVQTMMMMMMMIACAQLYACARTLTYLRVGLSVDLAAGLADCFVIDGLYVNQTTALLYMPYASPLPLPLKGNDNTAANRSFCLMLLSCFLSCFLSCCRCSFVCVIAVPCHTQTR